MARGRHFHTFDALRFLAFFKVFLYHAPIAGFAALDYVRAGGTFAVRFFFVLSGFLITYLILAEKEQTGRLAFKYFIVRRMLRIWPLYYLIVAFAFCTPYMLTALNIEYSNSGYEPNFLFTATFLENYVGILKHDAPNVSPLGVIWSVCVEEHFYIVWGLALWGLHRRHVPKLIAFSVALAIVSRSVFVASGYATLDLLTNIDYFAMGAIPAYLLTVQGERVAAWVDSIPLWLKRCYVVLVIGVVLVAPHVPGDLVKVLGPCVLGLFFGGLLMLLLSTRSSFGISDRNILSRLGKYTYGLYLYHVIILTVIVKIFERGGWNEADFVGGVLITLLALSVSVGVSAVSYHWFERPFLELKRYGSPAVVVHGMSAEVTHAAKGHLVQSRNPVPELHVPIASLSHDSSDVTRCGSKGP